MFNLNIIEFTKGERTGRVDHHDFELACAIVMAALGPEVRLFKGTILIRA